MSWWEWAKDLWRRYWGAVVIAAVLLWWFLRERAQRLLGSEQVGAGSTIVREQQRAQELQEASRAKADQEAKALEHESSKAVVSTQTTIEEKTQGLDQSPDELAEYLRGVGARQR